MERAPVLVRHAGGDVATLRQLPPGFRFRPTDEELVVQYLRRKAFGVPLPAAVITVVRDLYGLDPWDIPGASDGEKYFFAIRPAAKNGGSAATASGRWKPEGKERPVVLSRPCGGSLLVGVKRALAFAPHRGKKKTRQAAAGLTAGWVMHEYRLAASLHKNGCSLAEAEGEWVVCRVFRRSRQQPRRRAGDGTAPPSLSSASSASCVTDGSDQEEEEKYMKP
ncbi:hypothetical protein QOZ80_8BG0667320 [Eleusine coracana subsp. coracana]|nr:hypothetical protein QOZ80_8BG0667300 [Eleusine coracana subsp. coracana]KAK3122266.1 hypothetical protein QOZ80_8BG0667320 [Eleusine coracana subsp. coracana]